MTKDEALKLALEALEHMLEDAKQERLTVEYWNECVDAITAIKQVLAAPDLQAELNATNRQVEILSDALAESRREVAAEREACAKVCDDLAPPCGYNLTETSFWDVTSLECAAAIRARGNT
jgi:hypothetical protein